MIAALVHLTRLARAGVVFAREGVLGLVDPKPLPLSAQMLLRCARLIERPSSGNTANRLSTALTRLGPTYVKLGQFLATRPDVVGVTLARDLESLQDRMPPFSQAEAEATALDMESRSKFVSAYDIKSKLLGIAPGDFFVFFEKRLRIFAALADAFAFVAEPRT